MIKAEIHGQVVGYPKEQVASIRRAHNPAKDDYAANQKSPHIQASPPKKNSRPISGSRQLTAGLKEIFLRIAIFVSIAGVLILGLKFFAIKFFKSAVSEIFKKQTVTDLQYQSRNRLFSPAEFAFSKILEQAVGESYAICPKVRLADVIEVKSNNFRSSWSNPFRRISQKHLDFVICDHENMGIIGAVELDDRSHLRADRKERDQFVDQALQSAGIPILHQPARGKYSIQKLRSDLAETLGILFEEPESGGVDIGIDEAPKEQSNRVSVLIEKAVATCPDCGGKLDKRKIVHGGHTGKVILSCRNYPKCKHVVQFRKDLGDDPMPSEPKVTISADDVDEELERREPTLD
ncbi:MAG: DUF2726 domain-containing protein [Desulfobacterales bacterium]|nr:DUF2726 domain-containing protein [Desulfobacterales bacterium]